MALIGFCGHDDVSQGDYSWRDRSPAGREKANEKIQEIDREILGLQASMTVRNKSGQALTNSRISSLTRHKTDLGQNGLRNQMQCPKKNEMFLPGSLGEQVDIPETLKIKIAALQSPLDGQRSLSAKHYHVYGAAFMVCQMIEKGTPGLVAATAQEQAARVYRGIRVCEESNTNIARYTANRNRYTKERKRNEYFDEFIIRKVLEEKASGNEKVFSNIEEDYGVSLADTDVDEKIIRSKVKIALEKQGAAYLYQRWYLAGQTVSDVRMPCTDIKGFGPITAYEMNFKDDCVPEASPEMCSSSKYRLQSWMVDFEWTIAQHSLGGDFARQHCKERKDDSLDQMSCTALIRPSSGVGAKQEGTQ